MQEAAIILREGRRQDQRQREALRSPVQCGNQRPTLALGAAHADGVETRPSLTRNETALPENAHAIQEKNKPSAGERSQTKSAGARFSLMMAMLGFFGALLVFASAAIKYLRYNTDSRSTIMLANFDGGIAGTTGAWTFIAVVWILYFNELKATKQSRKISRLQAACQPGQAQAPHRGAHIQRIASACKAHWTQDPGYWAITTAFLSTF